MQPWHPPNTADANLQTVAILLLKHHTLSFTKLCYSDFHNGNESNKCEAKHVENCPTKCNTVPNASMKTQVSETRTCKHHSAVKPSRPFIVSSFLLGEHAVFHVHFPEAKGAIRDFEF